MHEQKLHMVLPGLKILMHFVMDFTAVKESTPALVKFSHKLMNLVDGTSTGVEDEDELHYLLYLSPFRTKFVSRLMKIPTSSD